MPNACQQQAGLACSEAWWWLPELVCLLWPKNSLQQQTLKHSSTPALELQLESQVIVAAEFVDCSVVRVEHAVLVDWPESIGGHVIEKAFQLLVKPSCRVCVSECAKFTAEVWCSKPTVGMAALYQKTSFSGSIHTVL